MKRGYAGEISNEFVFIIAKSIEEARGKFKKKAEGKPWKFDCSRNYKVVE